MSLPRKVDLLTLNTKRDQISTVDHTVKEGCELDGIYKVIPRLSHKQGKARTAVIECLWTRGVVIVN